MPSGGSYRTGGRGEFELVGDVPGGVSVNDLFYCDLLLRYGALEVPSGIYLTRQGGKKRLRLRDSRAGAHAGLQVAAVLMMPSPIRDEAKLEGGLPVLRTNGYLLHHVHLDDVRLIRGGGTEDNPGLFSAEVASVEFGNQSYQAESLDARARFADVSRIWSGADKFPEPLYSLLMEHRQGVASGGVPPRALSGVVSAIQEAYEGIADAYGQAYSRHEDSVPFLLKFLSFEPSNSDELTPPEQIPRDEVEIRAREVQRWRAYVRRRGFASVRFRAEVREAYDWTCVVCGVRLPSTPLNRRAGVDAAHILPWSDYDLDDVSNGLCLCRQHHWAFDEGLIRIACEDGVYSVELVPGIDDLRQSGFAVDSLAQYVGAIPATRLPNLRRERPNPEFLSRLYESL